jgi:hypothetical protein
VIPTETDDILKAWLFLSCMEDGFVIDWLIGCMILLSNIIKIVVYIPGLLLSLHI